MVAWAAECGDQTVVALSAKAEALLSVRCVVFCHLPCQGLKGGQIHSMLRCLLVPGLISDAIDGMLALRCLCLPLGGARAGDA
jgi:hypothetical protein